MVNAQRRFYRLITAGITCFLMGILLSQSQDIGVVNAQLYVSFILVFAGLILIFKALESKIHSENYIESTYEEDREKHLD